VQSLESRLQESPRPFGLRMASGMIHLPVVAEPLVLSLSIALIQPTFRRTLVRVPLGTHGQPEQPSNQADAVIRKGDDLGQHHHIGGRIQDGGEIGAVGEIRGLCKKNAAPG